MKLDSDDFELFDVPRRFEQDRSVLDGRWRALQARVHPDRFVAEGGAAQRVAMQWAVRVNEAYQRLKNPVRRAAYLCELAGVPVDAERNTAMPADFLMQQMAWREALDETSGLPAMQALRDDVAASRQVALRHLQELLDGRCDAAAAAQQVRELMFVERFAQEIDDRMARLDT